MHVSEPRSSPLMCKSGRLNHRGWRTSPMTVATWTSRASRQVIFRHTEGRHCAFTLMCDVDHSRADWQQAYKAGAMPAEVAQSYLQLASSIWGPLLTVPGFRDRLVADPSFVIKVAIEVGIGICTKVTPC
jgi:hypothetical protein